MGNLTSSGKKRETLAIDTTFKLPSDIPVWPRGDGFASGIIDLGGLQVSQISTFSKVWTTFEGGAGNVGATFFEPTGIPEGFFMLGCYCQPNNKPLFGFVLAGKYDSSSESDNGALRKPVDYTLVWSSKSLRIKQDKDGYIWLPTAPDGYKAAGHVVTNTLEKPSLDRIRCVRSDFTDQCEINSRIWGSYKNNDPKGFNVYDVRPSNRGIQAPGVPVGTFFAEIGGTSSPLAIACLKNTGLNFSSIPNLPQINALVQAYSPFMYLHPKEKYLPSSVNWFFTNGALLYKKEEEAKPVSIDPNGSNLPQGGNDDGAYWLDLPADEAIDNERVKKGDLESCQAYGHIKPMFGGTFTDIAMWIFYPFNGPARANIGGIELPLGKIGQHLGDWEHLTLRISNFDGGLRRVYFSQHSKGTWVDASELEFRNGNKSVAYSSLHGHSLYPKPGLVMQGTKAIGIRNDAAKSDKVMNIGVRFEIVSGEYLGSAITEPPWLKYSRKWGPTISYDLGNAIQKVQKVMPGNLRFALQKLEDILPNEVLGEEGPVGPKMKRNWAGDEVV